MIKGSIVALITPFNNDNEIDYESLDKLCQIQLDSDTDGLLLLGTTAEAEALTLDEKLSVLDFVINRVKHKIKVMVGLISNKYSEVLELYYSFKDYEIDSYLVIAPYYVKTNVSGLLKYFTNIADRVDKPIVLYNVPKRVGMEIPKDVVVALSYHNNIIGIKDASGNLLYQQELMLDCKNGFLYYSGDDLSMIASILLGADGVISVIGNAFPNELKKICNKKIDIKEFKVLFQTMKIMYNEVSPIGIKYILYLLGFCKLKYRIPLDEPSKVLKRSLEEKVQLFLDDEQ